VPNMPTATRFFQPGIVAILWFDDIVAETLTPTAEEIAAAMNLTNEVDDIAGWATSTAFIETKDAGTRLRPQLAGAVTFEGSSITFNGSRDGQDARTVFERGQSGFVMFADAGLATGRPGEVFPAEVGSVVKLRSLDNAPFKIRVDFGITAVPRDIVIPTLA